MLSWEPPAFHQGLGLEEAPRNQLRRPCGSRQAVSPPGPGHRWLRIHMGTSGLEDLTPRAAHQPEVGLSSEAAGPSSR